MASPDRAFKLCTRRFKALSGTLNLTNAPLGWEDLYGSEPSTPKSLSRILSLTSPVPFGSTDFLDDPELPPDSSIAIPILPTTKLSKVRNAASLVGGVSVHYTTSLHPQRVLCYVIFDNRKTDHSNLDDDLYCAARRLRRAINQYEECTNDPMAWAAYKPS